MNRLPLTGLTLGLLLSTALPASALPEDWQEKMIIESDRAELDRKSGTVVYEGHVVLRQGSLKIESDRLRLTLEGDQLVSALAEGQPAHYQQQVVSDKPMTQAHASRIEFLAQERDILFLGNGQLRQGNNTFSGEKILYDIDGETVTASGTASSLNDGEQARSRIQVVIEPATNTEEQASENAESE